MAKQISEVRKKYILDRQDLDAITEFLKVKFGFENVKEIYIGQKENPYFIFEITYFDMEE